MTKKGVRLRVKGRVQGVFYRQSTKEFAMSIGLDGWVRNEDDGSVLIEAFGPQEKLDSLINWCGHGPPHASVQNVEIEWLDHIPTTNGFRVTGVK